MKPAVLMMFRDEADILRKCLEHWYSLGVRDFYLCDNGSVDQSLFSAKIFAAIYPDAHVFLYSDTATDWPGRRVINGLKDMALSDGCDWIFPADADEFLQLPEGWTLQQYLSQYPQAPGWGGIRYLNILPDERCYFQEPQRKAFGWLTSNMMVSMGNHLIENVTPTLNYGEERICKHYSLRSYSQFKRKLENYMNAFSQTQFQDHHHAESYRKWQVEGESYIQRRWKELTGPDAIKNAPK